MRAEIESVDVGAVSVRRMGARAMSTRNMSRDALTMRAPRQHQTGYQTKVAREAWSNVRRSEGAYLASPSKYSMASQIIHPTINIALERTTNRRGSSVWSSRRVKTAKKTKMTERCWEMVHAPRISGQYRYGRTLAARKVRL